MGEGKHYHAPKLGADKQVEEHDDCFITSRHKEADSYLLFDGAHVRKNPEGKWTLVQRNGQPIFIEEWLEQSERENWPVYGSLTRRNMLRAGINE